MEFKDLKVGKEFKDLLDYQDNLVLHLEHQEL
jgi:hypothetical protein